MVEQTAGNKAERPVPTEMGQWPSLTELNVFVGILLLLFIKNFIYYEDFDQLTTVTTNPKLGNSRKSVSKFRVDIHFISAGHPLVRRSCPLSAHTNSKTG